MNNASREWPELEKNKQLVHNFIEDTLNRHDIADALESHNHVLTSDNRFDPVAVEQKSRIFERLGKEDEAKYYGSEAKVLQKANPYNPNRIG
jgi:hypothetical protein